MRKLFFSVAFAMLMSVTVHAQAVDSMFVNMPDSLFPYLSSAQRVELVNLKRVDTSTSAVLRSALDCEVALQYADAERMTLALDSTAIVELAMQKVNDRNVCCLLRTVPTPEPSTSAVLYDEEWKQIKRLTLDTVSFTTRPDTMSIAQYDELCKLIEFPLVEAHFEDASTIDLRLNVPLVSKDEREKLAAIIVQRKMKWNGQEYVCE